MTVSARALSLFAVPADDLAPLHAAEQRVRDEPHLSRWVTETAQTLAAAVGRPHDLKGEAVAVFVTLKSGEASEALKDELKKHVRKEIGALAQPDDIRFTSALPKTRSGKIMRRVLRAQALGQDPGDLTTLES